MKCKAFRFKIIWDDINPVNSQAKEAWLSNAEARSTSSSESFSQQQRRRSGRRLLLRQRHDRRRGRKARPQMDRHRPRQVRHPHHAQAAHPGAARAESRRQTFRAFEVLNLGRYERQAYLNVAGRLTGKKKEQALARKEQEFRD